MYGDFSRLTYDAAKHFSAVLKQQGRVELDADDNENTTILLRLLRALAEDLIGEHGGPANRTAFGVTIRANDADDGRLDDFTLSPGRYYVNGLLVEVDSAGQDDAGNPIGPAYYTQPYAYLDKDRRAEDRLPDLPLLVYLRAWEQAISAIEDPALREKALGITGPDTAVRARVVWQVIAGKRFPGAPDAEEVTADWGRDNAEAAWAAWEERRRVEQTGRLRARASRPAGVENDACIIDPDARYRGFENHLYRVEIHTGGVLGAQQGEATEAPTFKWSRDNGTVTFPILSLTGSEVVVASLGRDERCSLEPGDWVEIVDDAYAHRVERGRLFQVMDVDLLEGRVTLDEAPPNNTGTDLDRHPLLRRWDQRPVENPDSDEQLTLDPAGRAAQVIRDASKNNGWLALEDGIEVQFLDGVYQAGDYWLIPARAVDGTIEWPQNETGSPLSSNPHGVRYYYAPLWLLGGAAGDVDLRCIFNPLCA